MEGIPSKLGINLYPLCGIWHKEAKVQKDRDKKARNKKARSAYTSGILLNALSLSVISLVIAPGK